MILSYQPNEMIEDRSLNFPFLNNQIQRNHTAKTPLPTKLNLSNSTNKAMIQQEKQNHLQFYKKRRRKQAHHKHGKNHSFYPILQAK
jgi:hypothetical protein